LRRLPHSDLVFFRHVAPPHVALANFAILRVMLLGQRRPAGFPVAGCEEIVTEGVIGYLLTTLVR